MIHLNLYFIANGSTTFGVNATVATYSGNAWQKWELDRASNPSEGVVAHSTQSNSSYYNCEIPSKAIVIGETKTLDDLNLIVMSYQTVSPLNLVSWSTSDSSVASISSNGTVTANSCGMATITASYSGKEISFELYVIPIAEGTYVIENVRTEKYIDIENQLMSNGTVIHQWDYHSGATQRWAISYYSEGYYTISSAYNTGYYLAVQNDSSVDAAIVLKNGTITDGMMWEITEVSENKYKIVSKSGNANNKALSLNSSSSADNGNNIVQRTFVNDNNYEDEWCLYCISSMPLVNLDLIYDNAYLTRHTNAYQRIIDYASVLQCLYMKRFGVWVNYSLPAPFTSYADANCDTDPNEPCEHADDIDCINSKLKDDGSIILRNLHHKNLFNIWLRIPLPDTSETLRISFVGHRCCEVETFDTDGDGIDDSQSHEDGPLGITFIDFGSCMITNFDSSESEQKTFIHEFGHLYRAPDHYGGSAPTTDEKNEEANETIYSKYCIYGEYKERSSVLENLTICEGCQQAILDNANRYNHN